MTHKDDHWPTKAQAAQLAGCSIRTIERYIKAGKLETHACADGIRCNPDDLAELLPTASPAILPNTTLATRVATPSLSMPALLELLTAIASQLRQPHHDAPRPETLYLTLEQAAELSGLSTRYLQERIKAGTLPAIRDGRYWKLKRRDLQKL